MEQEAGLIKINFKVTVKSTIATPELSFKVGDTITGDFKKKGVSAFTGPVICGKVSTKNDLKGGVTYDLDLTSNGVMTGTEAPTTLPSTSGS